MSHLARTRPSRPAGVRLTPRGRVVVVAAVALVLLTAFWLGARRGAGATSGGDRTVDRAVPESVIVGRHDTLWTIAVRARPGVDPRVTVQRMIDLNTLSGSIINPGQRVLLPSR